MILATIAMLAIGQTAPLSCPVMGHPLKGEAAETLEYNGAKYMTCCAGCGAEFAKDPSKYLKAAKGKTIGIFLFDPITGLRLDEKKAKASSDFGGLRYNFTSAEEKAKFDKNPKMYTMQPKKEALYCPVNKEEVASYDKASGYGDYKGVRYYFCCAGCNQPFAADPAKYAPNAAKAVATPKVITVKNDEDTAAAPMASSFTCKHCGRKITVNSKEDMDKTCTVCKCGQSNEKCKPGGK